MGKIDVEFLTRLYKIFSPTKSERRMSIFVQSKLVEMGFPDFQVDDKYQIYRLKKNTRLLCAHMDQVSSCPLTRVYTVGDYIFGDGNLGADDKNGIYILFDLLKKFKHESFIFSTGEEAGCNVDEILDKSEHEEVLKTMKYGLVFDRRNGSDIIGWKNDYCTKEFDDKIEEIGKEFGYSSEHGSFSDCNKIRLYMSCVNLSCGYYKPHTEEEYTNISELVNARNLGIKILKTLNKKYDKPEIKTYYSRYRGSSYYNSYGYEYEHGNWRKGAGQTSMFDKDKKEETKEEIVPVGKQINDNSADIYDDTEEYMNFYCEHCNEWLDRSELKRGNLCPFCYRPAEEYEDVVEDAGVAKLIAYTCTKCGLHFEATELIGRSCPMCGHKVIVSTGNVRYCYFCGQMTLHDGEECKICGTDHELIAAL